MRWMILLALVMAGCELGFDGGNYADKDGFEPAQTGVHSPSAIVQSTADGGVRD